MPIDRRRLLTPTYPARQSDDVNRNVGDNLGGDFRAPGTDNLKGYSKNSTVGDITNVLGRSFYGFNHRNMPGLLPINRDTNGMVFFTRPNMNFSNQNLQYDRKLRKLLNKSPSSMELMIRCYLDNNVPSQLNVSHPLVDNRQAFIPILTNTLLSLPGWPDDINSTFTSEPGVYGEVFGYIDGAPDYRESYDLTANFRNVVGDPITKMFYYWSRYAKLVHEGLFATPYLENIVNNRIDYNTRIYVLILDESRRFVTDIAATGAAFPLSTPTGIKFNYEFDKPINEGAAQVSVPFRCFGFEVFDDILIDEFNRLVVAFNPGMSPELRNSSNPEYLKIPPSLLRIFNNYGYPYINRDTRELEWYFHAEYLKGNIEEFFSGSLIENP